jgi:FkbM family methyltransferase
MLIDLDFLVYKYNIKFRGILHVGAHECEEIKYYDNYIKRDKVLWIEALPEKVELSKKIYPDTNIVNAVVSDREEIVKFNVSNNHQSSSILDLSLHKIYHPDVWYVDSFEVKTQLLENIMKNYDIDYNFLNLDIQGAELKALKGMEKYIEKVDYIYTEVNKNYLYKDCALVNEIDEYLRKFGFERVETLWFENDEWGDSFYIKKKK